MKGLILSYLAVIILAFKYLPLVFLCYLILGLIRGVITKNLAGLKRSEWKIVAVISITPLLFLLNPIGMLACDHISADPSSCNKYTGFFTTTIPVLLGLVTCGWLAFFSRRYNGVSSWLSYTKIFFLGVHGLLILPAVLYILALIFSGVS